MEIQGSGIVNRYIAAQGPLPNSCADFWQMVWEQQSRLVVMLTTKVERGRVKCHQYWPELYETLEYNTLHITSMKEELTDSFAFREFTLINTEVWGASIKTNDKKFKYIFVLPQNKSVHKEESLRYICSPIPIKIQNFSLTHWLVGGWGPNLKIWKLKSRTDILNIFCEITLRWMLQDFTDG